MIPVKTSVDKKHAHWQVTVLPNYFYGTLDELGEILAKAKALLPENAVNVYVDLGVEYVCDGADAKLTLFWKTPVTQEDIDKKASIEEEHKTTTRANLIKQAEAVGLKLVED